MTESYKEKVGFSTNRGLKEYANAFGMSVPQMLEWLKKNRVLDIGAGGGLFQKEVKLIEQNKPHEEGPVITPIDIIYSFKEGLIFSRYATHLAFTNQNVAPTKQAVREVDKSFESNAIGASFNSLPFADESFERVLACYSFGIHSGSNEQLMQAFAEVSRVLKKDGEARVSVIYDPTERKLRTANRTFTYAVDDLPFSYVKLENSSSIDDSGTTLTDWYLRIKK